MPELPRVSGLASYNPDDTNDFSAKYGIAFQSWLDGDADNKVSVELTHTDLAFVLSAMVDRMGLDQVRRAIDRIAQDDPNGRHCGLSAPARILQGIDPRKAG